MRRRKAATPTLLRLLLLLHVFCDVSKGLVLPSSASWGRMPSRRLNHSLRPAHIRCALPPIDAQAEVGQILREAQLEEDIAEITEMSAGFCNWVYRVDLVTSGPIVVKLFSPLAKLRLQPDLRGVGDETASDEGLGPRLLHRSADGLVTQYIVGDTLTEADMHADGSNLPATIAPKLAAFHGPPQQLKEDEPPILWCFLDAMVEHIAKAEEALPEGITLRQIKGEVARMRARCDALALPIVRGHGDLKPSNVMMVRAAEEAVGADEAISFIDFELSGRHYRGYDLFKLFRTAAKPSTRNMRAFFQHYLAAADADADIGAAAAATSPSATALALELDVLQAEAFAAEPLTWLEAAVFFLFAICVYPEHSSDWVHLAHDRWSRYLASAEAVEHGGEAARALLDARAKLCAAQSAHA